MTSQQNKNIEEYQLSRQTALAMLATLSTSLLARIQFGPFTALLIEEFLSQSAASITSCWHLLRGDGLTTVEYALPTYIPSLIAVVKQSSTYRQRAAYLAAQGSLLLSLIALHRLRFTSRVAYCKQALEYASLSEDQTLLVTVLTHLGDAFCTNGQPIEMLQTYQQAEQYSANSEVSAFLRSKVLAELAHAYAQQGHTQEALRCLGQAHAIFAEESADTPAFLSTDYGLFQLILFEGLSALDLGAYEEVHDNPARAHEHYLEATRKLTRIEQIPQTIIVPARINVEIVNQRSLAAVHAGDLDDFVKHLLAGAKGAETLGSEKRRQEVHANWKAARKAWPHETKVLELADLLF